MARTGAYEVEGVVVEVLPKMLYLVELPNGHRLLAFGASRAGVPGLMPGDRVVVEVSPYDLSKGRVIRKVKPN